MSRARLLGALALAALTLAALPGAARAQTPAPTPHGFALQSYDPPPAGDRFFAVPEATTPGHKELAAALVLSWANDPMVLRVDGVKVPGGEIVQRQFWAFAQGSVGLGERFLVEATLPVALHQSGKQPLPDLAKVASSGLGDLRLGGRYAAGTFGGVALAAGLDLFLPTGSKEAFASDGAVRVQPKVILGGELGSWIYGADLGYLHRSSKDEAITKVGPALAYAAAAGFRFGEWRVGPELYGRYQFEGTATSPVEGLVGGHWSRGGWDVGLALGTGLDDSAGSAPFRVVSQVSWRPGAGAAEAAARAAAEKAAADRAAADRAAAERVAAERAAADQAAAEKAAAERAAADRAAAEQAAAEKAAAEKAAADKAAAERLATQETAHIRLTKEKIELLQAVQFETGQDVIRPESEGLLRDVAALLASHPDITKVRVEGHTDSVGPVDLNIRLSDQRARAVQRWLVEKGHVEGARLEAQGFGPQRPVAPNTTREGRAQNRRVEFKIVEQQ